MMIEPGTVLKPGQVIEPLPFDSRQQKILEAITAVAKMPEGRAKNDLAEMLKYAVYPPMLIKGQ